MSHRRRDSGQALVFFALAMVVVMGFVGLAIDIGYMRYMKRRIQTLADAAAVAGAKAISPTCTGSCVALTTAAQYAIVENGVASPTNDGTCNPAPSVNNVSYTINNGPSCLGSATDPYYHNTNYVEAIVADTVPTAFTAVLGISSSVVSARAEAGLVNSNDCIYSIAGSGKDTFYVNSATVNLPNCTVYNNSPNPNAVHCTSIGTSHRIFVFGEFEYAAAHTAGDCAINFGGGTSQELPNAPPITDPLSNLTAPSAPGANGSCKVTSGNFTCSPGLFTTTNPFSIAGGGNVTLSPGIYYIQSGGLFISGGTVTGTGVTFYVVDGSLTNPTSGSTKFGTPNLSVSINAGSATGTVQISAPTSTSDSLYGMLIWQQSTDSNTLMINGGSNTYFSGTLYAPGGQIDIGGDSTGGNSPTYNSGASWTALDANQIAFDGGGGLGNITINAPPAGTQSTVRIATIGE